MYPGAFLVAFAEGMLNLGIVFFLRERLGAGPGLIGWFMGFSVLAYILGCLLLQPVFERLRPQTVAAASLSSMTGFLLLLLFLPWLPLDFPGQRVVPPVHVLLLAAGHGLAFSGGLKARS